MSLDIRPGDEIIIIPFTFFSPAGIIARLSLIPVFVDIDPAIYNINIQKIEVVVTERTKDVVSSIYLVLETTRSSMSLFLLFRRPWAQLIEEDVTAQPLRLIRIPRNWEAENV